MVAEQFARLRTRCLMIPGFSLTLEDWKPADEPVEESRRGTVGATHG